MPASPAAAEVAGKARLSVVKEDGAARVTASDEDDQTPSSSVDVCTPAWEMVMGWISAWALVAIIIAVVGSAAVLVICCPTETLVTSTSALVTSAAATLVMPQS